MSNKKAFRLQLQAQRLAMPDRLEKAAMLQSVLRSWLLERDDLIVGAYWPIHGEFDPLPALHRWQELAPAGAKRQIALPVTHKETKKLTFHEWYPGCQMEKDAYDIPKPKDTTELTPTLLLIPCLGYAPQGMRLGYGGGFYDRTLATLTPEPYTVGLAYSMGFIESLKPESFDIPLKTILTENGVEWSS